MIKVRNQMESMQKSMNDVMKETYLKMDELERERQYAINKRNKVCILF